MKQRGFVSRDRYTQQYILVTDTGIVFLVRARRQHTLCLPSAWRVRISRFAIATQTRIAARKPLALCQ
eukprot:COSAG03_NODE_10971_length_618_cov_1.751445_2_plen_67_part_01